MVMPPSSGKAMRLSLSGLVIAGTGKLKSFIYDQFIKPLSDHQEAQKSRCDADIGAYATAIDVWKINKSVIKKEIKRKVSEGEDAAKNIEELRQLNENPPEAPGEYTMLHSDADGETIFRNKNNHKSLLVASSEGSIITEGPLLKKLLGMILEVFSGTPSSSEKNSKGRFDLSNTMISILILIQDNMLAKALEKIRDRLNSMGYFGRTICCYVPESYENGPMENNEEDLHILEEYTVRMEDFYQQSYEVIRNPYFKAETAHLTPEAAEILGAFKENIKEQSRKGGFFHKILDVSYRAAEIVLKLSGIIHFFEKKQGDISAETINTAIGIYAFFLPDHVCIYNSAARIERHAEIVHEYLYDVYIVNNRRFLLYCGLIQDITNKHIRDKQHIRLAINKLVADGKVKLFTCGDRPCIDLKPHAGNPIRDAEYELFTFEGMNGPIQYEPNNYRHHIFEMGMLPNGNHSMFLTVNTMAIPAFTGFGKFITDENGEMKQINSFD